jgi:hypothetical protein
VIGVVVRGFAWILIVCSRVASDRLDAESTGLGGLRCRSGYALLDEVFFPHEAGSE